ncbi:unnamed protein product [Ostreobium quekettii]|uniref:Uncharacterized protein n=1 Tax=Ostreobium quekettii TaxID=121088 RepID=A0A8S1J6V2_9CHLO|nr:unnamed protein product [Ostreobium quekettii]|eukprot:evm.model.scf_1061.3 EVM.evm.TU.scf_1061.3   scf_1061:20924-22261(-)
MDDLRRASALVASIDAGLDASGLRDCDRLRRCISAIVPLLDKLQTMKRPWGASAMRALAQLQSALERTDGVVAACAQASGDRRELDCQFVGALRQLWQRQIEMNLAVQFQHVLDEDIGRTARGIFGEQEMQPGGVPGLVAEKIGLKPSVA